MTVYRVGPEGATVFSPEGAPVIKLPPGHLVVPGTTEAPNSAAARAIADPKRLGRYADKQMRPPEDKAR